ncbi:MAG: T-complex 10 C-terminal domain-containing protein, partial [Mycobacterium sp.]
TKCLCTFHHLLKTFCGWHDEQLPDGTVIWTLPNGHKAVTLPGSAYLFPSLCVPTGFLPAPTPEQPDDSRGHRIAKMPRRTRTRTQNRTAKITTERGHNHRERVEHAARQAQLARTIRDEPPPF